MKILKGPSANIPNFNQMWNKLFFFSQTYKHRTVWCQFYTYDTMPVLLLRAKTSIAFFKCLSEYVS